MTHSGLARDNAARGVTVPSELRNSAVSLTPAFSIKNLYNCHVLNKLNGPLLTLHLIRDLCTDRTLAMMNSSTLTVIQWGPGRPGQSLGSGLDPYPDDWSGKLKNVLARFICLTRPIKILFTI